MRQQREALGGHLAEVDEVGVQDAAHAAARAEDPADAGRAQRLVHGAVQGGVDDRGGPAPVHDEKAVGRHADPGLRVALRVISSRVTTSTLGALP